MNDETTSTATEQPTQDTGTTPETVETPADAKSDTPMIPKARFDEVNGKLKELKSAAEELEALKQAQADEAAQKANDIDKFRTERDSYKTEAEQWRTYATAQIEAVAGQLDDAGRGILEDLGEDVPLHKRLAVAQKLAGSKKTEPGFGTNGGKGTAESSGVIPAEVKTKQDFHQWWAGLLRSPEGRMKAADSGFNEKVKAERLRRFG